MRASILWLTIWTVKFLVVASPIAKQDSTLSLAHVRNPHFTIDLARSKEYIKARYERGGISRPTFVLTDIERPKKGATANSVSFDTGDMEYLFSVDIGGQEVNVNLDTGSSDLWVFSTETAKADLRGQSLYDPALSPTAELLEGYTWDITYGAKPEFYTSTGGIVFLDTVTIGGLAATRQAVELAQTVGSQLHTNRNCGGILGLGFSGGRYGNTVLPVQQKTWFENVQHSLPAPIFTVDYRQDGTGSHNFGYIERSSYSGNITYTPVDSTDGYWTFTSSGYAVGARSFISVNNLAIADTASTMLYVPPEIAALYWADVVGAALNSSGYYFFLCGTKLPSFTFGVSDSRYVIPGSYMGFPSHGWPICIGGIQSNAMTGGLNIFGIVLLKAVFVVFDADGPRLGFASKHL